MHYWTPSEYGAWIASERRKGEYQQYSVSDWPLIERLLGMQRHNDSHLDHGLTIAQVDYLLQRFADRDAFFIETIELPVEFGTVPCTLYGPAMGDHPIGEAQPVVLGTLYITYARRGARQYDSRLINLPARPTRLVTVIAGPHEGIPCILYTAFGGPATPREPRDPTLVLEAEIDESRAFWAVHALSREP